MRSTEVGAVWGVGRKTSARLNEGGIRNVLDLVQADVSTLRRQFSVVLEKTILELRGTSCLEVDDAPAANQQIMSSSLLPWRRANLCAADARPSPGPGMPS